MTEGVTAAAKLVSVVSFTHRAELANAICSMSTATLEIPSSSTQLYFTWNDEVEATDRATCLPPVADMPVVARTEAIAEYNQAAVASTSSYPVANVSQRQAQPTKVGSLLLQLLKRYGITDEEIAAGVAAYEEKRLQLASV